MSLLCFDFNSCCFHIFQGVRAGLVLSQTCKMQRIRGPSDIPVSITMTCLLGFIYLFLLVCLLVFFFVVFLPHWNFVVLCAELICISAKCQDLLYNDMAFKQCCFSCKLIYSLSPVSALHCQVSSWGISIYRLCLCLSHMRVCMGKSIRLQTPDCWNPLLEAVWNCIPVRDGGKVIAASLLFHCAVPVKRHHYSPKHQLRKHEGIRWVSHALCCTLSLIPPVVLNSCNYIFLKIMWSVIFTATLANYPVTITD